VGNVMIDTLLKNKARAATSNVLSKLNLDGNDFAVLTLHRPVNVDDLVIFSRILDALEVIQRDMPIIFPVHPRTKKNLVFSCLGERMETQSNLRLIDALGYLDFLKLMSSARVVLTDSGGIQEETTVLGIPCLTLRENTERPITAEIGTNQVVGTERTKIIEGYNRAMNGQLQNFKIPPLWDGHAAERIVKILLQRL